MRSTRQHRIDIAVAACLVAAGTYLLPDSVLKADAARMVVPRPSESELLDSISYHDKAGHLTSIAGETEQKRKLNDAGRAWHLENA